MRKFISYYPLKQGLKPLGSNRNDNAPNEFISYYPLKQGLKLNNFMPAYVRDLIYILLSIKTRIETGY